jgi:phosphotransferase system IIB component
MSMKWICRLLEASLLCAAFCIVPSVFAADDVLDTGRIEQLTGLKGTLSQQEGVFKVNFPRKDFQAIVGGNRVIPDQGVTAWAAFTRAGDHTMVMGDIVLLENEVNPVMSAALDNGLEVTALHNHFLWDSPRVMFMHIGGMGDQETVARAVGRVFGKLKEVISTKPSMPAANVDPAKTSFDPEDIEQIVGAAGVLNNGVYKIVIGRTAKMGEHEVGKEMGINTWAAFAGSEQQAVVDGDIAMLEGEVQGVLKALRRANINIVAIHNHMIGESPRYVFLHYWGVGSVEDLANGLKAALATQSSQ